MQWPGPGEHLGMVAALAVVDVVRAMFVGGEGVFTGAFPVGRIIRRLENPHCVAARILSA